MAVMDKPVWDLFCRVIDNFGDVGVCWRLAAQLAARGHAVRLWIDDPSALAWMAPEGTHGAPGVQVLDRREDAGYITPLECAGDYNTFVSRIRDDITVENGLAMWVVSDNLRKGAALNAVQIAEALAARHLKKQAA